MLLEILRFAQDDKWGFVGVFLERTKYRIRVGRGLAPAAYALYRRGRKRRAIRESPLQPVGNGLDRSD